jgi:hypothetical protein
MSWVARKVLQLGLGEVGIVSRVLRVSRLPEVIPQAVKPDILLAAVIADERAKVGVRTRAWGVWGSRSRRQDARRRRA